MKCTKTKSCTNTLRRETTKEATSHEVDTKEEEEECNEEWTEEENPRCRETCSSTETVLIVDNVNILQEKATSEASIHNNINNINSKQL